jgi:microcystin-dependent protein
MKYSSFSNRVLPPVGSITAFVGNIAQTADTQGVCLEACGWMVCDGRTLPKVQYPELYAVLGNLYGSDDITFGIPDLSGVFLRGIGNQEGSLENRTAAPKGTVTGVGSRQESALQTHVHPYDKPMTPAADVGTSSSAVVSIAPDKTKPPTDIPAIHVSAYETRPVNVFVYYLIKYVSVLPSF